MKLSLNCVIYFTSFVALYLYFARITEIMCDDGVLVGGASQNVCLGRNTVVKQPKTCDGIFEYKCFFRNFKQKYTNRKWFTVLNDHRAIAKIANWDPLTFERVDHVDTKPNCVENLLRLHEIDDRLSANGLIITDVNIKYNLVLDEGGNVTLIDFNIFPAITRPLIKKYDHLSQLIDPFINIYGTEPIDKWIFC